MAHGQDGPLDIRSHPDHPRVFDELVIDHWLHVEMMDDRLWWIDVGGTHINIWIDGDGRPIIWIEQVETPDEVAQRFEQTRRAKE